jgi:hypothetical protein
MIPYVELNLDGKAYKLRFGMGAMVAFEKTTGKKLMELDENMSVETTAELLYAMMRQENKELTFEDTMTLVDNGADSITEITAKVTEAITAAFTGGKSKNANPPTTENPNS